LEIKVGNNPIRKYLLYILSNIQKESELVIRGRGRAVKTCVDLAELVKRQVPGIVMDSIVIGTETIKDKQTSRDIRVSTIDITLKKPVTKEVLK
jgi:DNA-binding protein Alba